MRKLATMAATMLLMNFITSPGNAASADDELSIMAAEQRRDENVEIFEEQPIEPVNRNDRSNRSTDLSDDKSKDRKSKDDTKSDRKSNDKSDQSKKNDAKSPAVNQPTTPPVEEPPVTEPRGPERTIENLDNTTTNVGMQNPIVSFGRFDEAVEEVGFIPLYVSKRSGYVINYIGVIGGRVAEVRYSRRWEPEVKLTIRTYKRAEGEDLRDISGVYGVKWRVDLSSGMSIYLARINETTNAAAWASGRYTFAAMTENLSFAAFRTLVFEELADLSSHYYIEY